MTMTIQSLIKDPSIAAISFRQVLEPVEGRGTPIFPPTYPAPEKAKHRLDTPYTVNQGKDGTLICDIDSVQSQANRMERFFSDELAGLVPQHAIIAGDKRIKLTELPHRIADAAIRATALGEDIHEWMLAYANGDPVPLAKINPTSFVYGAWDSRDTQVKLPRAIRSEIRAFDVSVFTRSSQFSGAFNQADLELDDAAWGKEKGAKAGKAAKAGFAPKPTVDAHGGVLVEGVVVHSATVLVSGLRRYMTGDDHSLLPKYLLALALTGLLKSNEDYNLRSGCWLIPTGEAEWTTVSSVGKRENVTVDTRAIMKEAQNIADAWADAVNVTLGGDVTEHAYDPEIGKNMALGKEQKK